MGCIVAVDARLERPTGPGSNLVRSSFLFGDVPDAEKGVADIDAPIWFRKCFIPVSLPDSTADS